MPRTLTFNLEDDLDRSNSNNNDDDGTGCCSSIGAAVAESQLSASPFFRLPLEVRRIIYMQVLGGQRLHIVRKHKRLRFLRCRAPSLEECPTPKCRGSVDGEGVWTGGFSGKERTDGGVLNLLLVCRRVYVIFYSVYRSRSLTEIVCSGRRQESAPRRSVMVSALGPQPSCSSAGVTPNLRRGSMTSIC